MRWVALAGITALLAACEPGAGVLVVQLRSDLVAGIEVDEVVVSVDGAERARRAIAIGDDLLAGIVAAEVPAIPSGPHRVELALSRASSPVASQTTAVSVAAATSVTVVVTRDCRGVDCGAGEAARACLGARCVEPSCTPETPEACPAPECTAASDCAAASACATVLCSNGVCLYGDAGICDAASEYCDPEFGCALRPGARRPPTIVVSTTPDRAVAIPLENAILSGPVFIHASGAAGGTITAIEYRIDAIEDHQPVQIADTPPYFDLVGESTAALAAALNASLLPDGAHVLRAVVRWDDGTSDERRVAFQTAASIAGWHWTDDPLRSALRPLDAATIPAGDAYVVWAPGMRRDVLRVRFWVDDPMRMGMELNFENAAPYDLVGTSRTTPFDGALPWVATEGLHTLTALLELEPPGEEIVETTFTVTP